MGRLAGDTYGLGISLAFASYQASRVPAGSFPGALLDALASALQTAEDFANDLETQFSIGGKNPARIQSLYLQVRPRPGVAGDPHGLQAPIESLRGDYRSAFSPTPLYLDVFDLAVGLGLAEAQSTTSETLWLVADALKNTIAVTKLPSASQLGAVIPVQQLSQIDARSPSVHDRLSAVRQEYQTLLTNSPLI